MPQPLVWSEIKSGGDFPGARFGHTMTAVGPNMFVLFGGVDLDPKTGKVLPSNEIYTLRIDKHKCQWNKEECTGDIPLPRAHHSAVALPGEKLFIFGGYYSTKQRLNDGCILQVSTMTWKRPLTQDPVNEPGEGISKEGAPSARANHSVCLLGNKVYLYGGHGGANYERRVFNDTYSWDIETHEWEQLSYESLPQDPRCGHTIFGLKNKLYLFGGWNNESYFNNLVYLDLETREWTDPEIVVDIPRWNHAGLMVEAIPNWKYFIYGGQVGEFSEGKHRSIGQYTTTSSFLDIVDQEDPTKWKWTEIETEDEPQPLLPLSREYPCMVQDKRESRLVVYGGWHNQWLKDVWTINVGIIVGPPYAIMSMDPNLGQLSGNNLVKITGVGFMESAGIIVRFICGKSHLDVPGTYVSDTELTCHTPNFENFGAKPAEVRLQIKGGDMSITFSTFSFFMNTRAFKTLAYGPGLLNLQAPKVETELFIQARNDNGENRKSGRDKFEVRIRPIKGKEEDEEGVEKVVYGEEIQVTINDLDTGMYHVKYKVEEADDVQIDIKFENEKGKLVPIRGSPFIATFDTENKHANSNQITGPLQISHIKNTIGELEQYTKENNQAVTLKDKNVKEDVKQLLKVTEHLKDIEGKKEGIVLKMDTIEETLKYFEREDMGKDGETKRVKKLFENWNNLLKTAKETQKEIKPIKEVEAEKTRQQIHAFEERLKVYSTELKKRDFYFYKTGVDESLEKLKEVDEDIAQFNNLLADLGYNAKQFEYPEQIDPCTRIVEQITLDVENIRKLWTHTQFVIGQVDDYLKMQWLKTEPFEMEDNVKKLMKNLNEIRVDRKCNAFMGINDLIKRWLKFLPLCAEFRDTAIRERHWVALKEEVKKDFEVNDELLLQDIWDLNINLHGEAVEDLADQARQEAKMENTLKKLDDAWTTIDFNLVQHKDTTYNLLKLIEEHFDLLEEHQVAVQNMLASRFLSTFEKEVVGWQQQLGQVMDVYQLLCEVQKTWSFLENLFIHSEEVKKELPNEAEKFIGIDKSVKEILKNGEGILNVHKFCNQEDIMQRLEDAKGQLSICEKALIEFMDGKRRAFPRFYFISPNDLLDILSNGNSPAKLQHHLSKVFLAIGSLELIEKAGARPEAKGMHACVGKEYVDFSSPLQLLGKVEVYLNDVIDKMRSTLNMITKASVQANKSNSLADWLLMDPTQVTIIVNLIVWVTESEDTLNGMSSNRQGLKNLFQKQVDKLTQLIKMVQGQLEREVRTKVMVMITMDTHGRDVIERLENESVTKIDEFQWQSQLKAYWDMSKQDAKIAVCDASFFYSYEYLGNGPRLVITPLTDRIYVTATQALHLKMGCAPAGPAGTGKTETTKDLAAAMGKACYVINCSPQMDYIGMGCIFKGLSSSGSWGCFDEFNRLVPAVLSVCSVQFKAVTDAIKEDRNRFIIEGDEISLDPTCGVFITMNPGYLGRAELPEGLKSLFRPITVVVPDLELICENFLMAEGFVGAKILARKFTILYSLCNDLLSKQLHYEWGLRAIKSVLVVAGMFKREEPELSELALLLRALRDFNLPKIVSEDLSIFHGLLGDLFPGIEVERKVDLEFEDLIKQACLELSYYPDPGFVLKVVELSELLEIRHCVFVMGPSGAGKSATWRVLGKALDLAGKKSLIVDINPKAVNTDELYGLVNPATREWKDGLLSKIMRDLQNMKDTNPKYMILDGDLDTIWIESMNSVMDDNKILTLASNERISLLPHMRMLFEIRNLKFASLATVSRAGILYISDMEGYQWRAYIKSWFIARQYAKEVTEKLDTLFEKYVGLTFQELKLRYKFIVPVVEIQMVTSLCKILEFMLQGEIKGLEYIFVFCCVWAIGAGLGEQDGYDYRREFSSWWKNTHKVIKFPSKGTIFDYYVDKEASKLEEWNKIVPEVQFDSGTMVMTEMTVPTPETVAAQFFMKGFLQVGHSPLLVGKAGCGKTQICKGLLKSLNNSEYTYQVINFNYYTDAELLQMMLESNLEKKAGREYGPPAKLKMVYYIDDVNLPRLDEYETQSAVALLRQHADYKHWYNKNTLEKKIISNTQYLSSMNPTAGSFSVNPRLQRHFWMLAVSFPEQSSLVTIYSTFMTGHFKAFKNPVQEQVLSIIKVALTLHNTVETNFKKTALNFHYEFNIRHLSGIFQGLIMSQPSQFLEPEKLCRLWIHESERIYGDRLVSPENMKTYRSLVLELVKRTFKFTGLQKFLNAKTPEMLVFAHFANGLNSNQYDQFKDLPTLQEALGDAMKEYNEINAAMDLVLFEDALKHVCKITRIVSNTGGHALLVGVGGMGKQSLSKLAAFICQYTKVGIMISSTYGINDLKTDLQNFYQKAGIKDEGLLFLFTEGQITNEKFLVYINDLLASGEIADLYQKEEMDQICNNIRPAVKSAGITDTPENLWTFFIQRIRSNLHMALCFSPVGEQFRSRAQKFPALVNCTVIDWFQPWPYDALLSVGERLLLSVEMPDEETRDAIIRFMPNSYEEVRKYSEVFYEMEKRNVYTTPKSFLELIKLFQFMFNHKKTELEDTKTTYEDGVIKLQTTQEEVTKLEAELQVFSVEVEAKKKVADERATVVGARKEIVEKESDKANAEAIKCAEIKTNVEEKQAKVQTELDLALPLVENAKAALDVLKIDDFRMIKAFATPPKEILDVFSCVINMLAGVDELVEIEKNGKPKDIGWKQAKILMGNPGKLLDRLKGFGDVVEKCQVSQNNFKANKPILGQENMNAEKIKKVSETMAGIFDWVTNITMYHEVVVTVEPKRIAVKEATEQLRVANEKKETMDALVAQLEADLQELVDEYNEAMDQKNKAEAEANKCKMKLDLATRLVSALGSEYERWQASIVTLGERLSVLIGDVLIASAFVSYVGPFSKKYRDDILENKFMKFCKDNKIAMSPNPNPLLILTDEAEIATWNNQKLPADRVSIENGTILVNSERWPLMIDPQLQGIVWVKEKEKKNTLQVTRLSYGNKMIRTLESSIEAGYSVLIENMGEQIDAVLDPVIARNYIRRGKSKYIRLGDKELNVSNDFRLFMHTKLSNPEYRPEIQAETTLINFTVTEAGLEDQLLDLVVKKERPDLAKQRERLIKQQNEFKIRLKELEKSLLYKLSTSENVLEDVELVENLETSKKVSIEIKEKVEIATVTSKKINMTAEKYRSVAARGALIFFLMTDLSKIHSFYRYSLEAFIIVAIRAIKIVQDRHKKDAPEKDDEEEEEKAVKEAPKAIEGEEGEAEEGEKPKEGEEAAEEEEEELEEVEELTPKSLAARVEELTESLTYQSFSYIRRGLFEMHKLIFSTMMTFRILARENQIDADELAWLIQGNKPSEVSRKPENLGFLNEQMWGSCKAIEQLSCFTDFCKHMESEGMQWQKWYLEEKAEIADLPKTYKNINLFRRLLLLRALRPDRLEAALTLYVGNEMGDKYVDSPNFVMEECYQETSAMTPIFFVLFPGVDPTKEVEDLCKTLGYKDRGLWNNISLGQGQEDRAINILKEMGEKGGWVFLQNVHLMDHWLKRFELELEIVSATAHQDFRCFISSEPPPIPNQQIVPESILQNCIKVANEAAQSLKANMRRAFALFGQDRFDKTTKPTDFKALLFGLCVYHSLILGRKKFGSQGFARIYNFNEGDLRICADVLHNYLENYTKVPYADLQYIYGEIMYGGHITDEWDRRTNSTYLKTLIKPEIKEGMTLMQGFKSPDAGKFERDNYRRYIEEKLPVESPVLFGMHPNAEIGYLTAQGVGLFNTILMVSGGSSGGSGKGEDAVKEVMNELLDQIPKEFNLLELNQKIKEKDPFIVVAMQECERMNNLVSTISTSLTELDSGFKGHLNITEAMDNLSKSISLGQVYGRWADIAYPSKKALADWFQDMLERHKQLDKWTENMERPKSLWISGLFNPMSYMTAIMQVTSREFTQPLDYMCLQTNVTNYLSPEEVPGSPEAGAYIHGFFIDGASWELGRDNEQGYLTDMKPKELTPPMPVINVVSVDLKDKKTLGYYTCPTYVTTMRGPTYVFPANLKMEAEDSDEKLWILKGVCLLMTDD